MSQNYFIKNLLNIKDKNINFSENYFSFENINGINTKIIHAKLTYSADNAFMSSDMIPIKSTHILLMN